MSQVSCQQNETELNNNTQTSNYCGVFFLHFYSPVRFSLQLDFMIPQWAQMPVVSVVDFRLSVKFPSSL